MGKISTETDGAFRVSLPGKEVLSSTPEDLAIHSGFDYPKIEEHLEGYNIVTFPNSVPDGNTTLFTVDHNYGYKPSWLVFIDDIDDNLLTEFARLPYTESLPVNTQFYVEMTTTQMKIMFRYDDFWGDGDLNTTGLRYGFKWQIWVND